MGPVIAIAVLLILGWAFLWLPSQRRQRAHKAMQDDIEAGDEIITAGGIHGRVVTAEDEVVEVEIAPAVKVKLDRRAVAAVARDVEVEADEEPAPGAPAEPR
jgi:preprotein translocase subunit YajC